MENQSTAEAAAFSGHPRIDLINAFAEITACASRSEALFFLESHGFDLDAAVSTYLDDAGPGEVAGENRVFPSDLLHSHQYSPSESNSLAQSPRSRSPSPPPPSRGYNLRSSAGNPRSVASDSGERGRGGGGRGITTLADLSRGKSPKNADSDSDPDFDPQEYYTGGEKSGMLVQGPSKPHDLDAFFNQVRQLGAVEASAEHLLSSSSGSFSGTGRLLSGEVSANPQQPPELVNHIITFWRNGFTVDDGPLRMLDDPANESFLESIRRSEYPTELIPAGRSTKVQVHLIRREEDYKEPEKPFAHFQGVGRTLGSANDAIPPAVHNNNNNNTSLPASSPPSSGLIVDETQPSTSIQLRLADGTRMVSRFNNSHRIRDIRGFIDASRPNGTMSYQLQIMGFPPKQLSDLDQTIDEAGIANSVVIQKI
ncbi:hypothetical protein M569_12538 [Genlisea aurea]|uniref:UBX domain-containing protein n=1 Tax=Genlisea aurea TaxID=192259 RepID=S8C672_9LAMI|nr:hypothetical protein M569_12538 [Genlisea aurea]